MFLNGDHLPSEILYLHIPFHSVRGPAQRFLSRSNLWVAFEPRAAPSAYRTCVISPVSMTIGRDAHHATGHVIDQVIDRLDQIDVKPSPPDPEPRSSWDDVPPDRPTPDDTDTYRPDKAGK
jgi:hypothetical protein